MLLAIKGGAILGALAAQATNNLLRGNRGGNHVGNRRGNHGGNHGGNRGYGGRGKRSVVSEEQIGEQFVFDAIASMDNLDCGKRYLCEIAATPINQLSQEELSSLLLFQVKIDILPIFKMFLKKRHPYSYC